MMFRCDALDRRSSIASAGVWIGRNGLWEMGNEATETLLRKEPRPGEKILFESLVTH
jgi:hypothetical protein